MTRRHARIARWLERRREEVQRDRFAARVVEVLGENARRRAEDGLDEQEHREHVGDLLVALERGLARLRETLGDRLDTAADLRLQLVRDGVEGLRQALTSWPAR